jgi:hypothetical protein
MRSLAGVEGGDELLRRADAPRLGEQLVPYPEAGVPYDGFSVVSGNERAAARTSFSVTMPATVVSKHGAL